ncbi:LOW QUALITY PROTEIN: hypothetical protein BC938DRAFT_478774 [Jimgerdemannia flammicorona]|uniref:Uncharacterized protein n=1 Tax=Jimgerdemannia flammicorona TaxID=994334 RepID=A0A433QMA7_9FUNG|nr:LOW QUALITY PROTEIN: hypothetical protein BC938DRAFT_478774 [Jimgerdemannia flammicorona]
MTIYHKAVWFFTDFRNFTKSGYERRAASFNKDALDVDLTGKVAIVTGASENQPHSCSTPRARPCTCFAGTSDAASMPVVISWSDWNAAQATSTDPVSIREWIERFEKVEEKVHILFALEAVFRREEENLESCISGRGEELLNLAYFMVNNAGVMVGERTFTSVSMEQNFSNEHNRHILPHAATTTVAEECQGRSARSMYDFMIRFFLKNVVL